MKINSGITVRPYFEKVDHSTELTMLSPAFMETTKLNIGDVALAQVDGQHQVSNQLDVGLVETDFRIVGEVRYFPTMYEELEAGFLITSRQFGSRSQA